MSDPLNTNQTSQEKTIPPTEQLIERVLQQNLVNLTKKLKSGGSLTPAELNALRAEISVRSGDKGSMSGYVRTQVELAECLGIERKTVQRWLKEPGNPGARADGRYPLQEWKEWAEKNGKRIGDTIDATLERAKNIVLQNEILEFRLKVLRRDYVSMEDVEVVGAKLAVALRKVIGTIHLLAPSLEQVTANEAEALLKDKEDELIGQIRVLANDLARLGEAEKEEIKPGNGEGG